MDRKAFCDAQGITLVRSLPRCPGLTTSCRCSKMFQVMENVPFEWAGSIVM